MLEAAFVTHHRYVHILPLFLHSAKEAGPASAEAEQPVHSQCCNSASKEPDISLAGHCFRTGAKQGLTYS